MGILEACKPRMAQKLFFDPCNCPKMICYGCPKSEKLDVQLLLDASGSMSGVWKDLINKIKENFVGSILTNPTSRMAIAMFGDAYKIITKLSAQTSGSTLDAYTNFRGMGHTHLANALKKLLPAFQHATKASKATKILIVITDGEANGPGNVSTQAAKWAKAVDAIYVLGFGDISMEGLKKIKGDANGLVYKSEDLSGLEEKLIKNVVPKICKQPTIVV